VFSKRRKIVTREDFFKWLNTCPANWGEDTANPTSSFFEIINDDFENTTIRFFYDEEMIEGEDEL
tara:strand:+ start:31 stop:225 length:195 start_codon:yes stop_codon:yes gene_type:complete